MKVTIKHFIGLAILMVCIVPCKAYCICENNTMLLPASVDTLSLQCRFTEEPFELNLRFEFEDDSTVVSVFRNSNRVENTTCNVYDGYEMNIDISQYGGGDYYVTVTPKSRINMLVILFGYDEPPVDKARHAMDSTDVMQVKKGEYESTKWHADYASLGDMMMVVGTKDTSIGNYWNYLRQEAVPHYPTHSRNHAGLGVPHDTSPWIFYEGRGLYSWEDGTAVVCGLENGDVLEFIYDCDRFNFYGQGDVIFYSEDHTTCSADDGAAKEKVEITKPTKNNYGHAIYEMLEDGNVGFGLLGGGAIREINIYRKEDISIVNAIQFDSSDSKIYDLNGRAKKFGRKGFSIRNRKIEFK